MIYYLNNNEIPTIPTPHDCVIKTVTIDRDFLTFIFENDISQHDSIKSIQPNAKSLIIKIHLLDSFDTYKFKYYKWPLRKATYTRIDNRHLCKMAEREKLIYIGHYVGYQSVIIDLHCETSVKLSVTADFIEFNWIL